MDTYWDSGSFWELSTEEDTVAPQGLVRHLSEFPSHGNKGTAQNKPSLFAAVKEHDTEMLDKLLLRSDVNRNEENCYGETALIMSIRLKRSFAFVSRLVESSCYCHIDAVNAEGQTALHVAVIAGAIDVAHKLIRGGADPNAYDAKGGTPLYYAVAFINLESVCMLLSCGADARLASIYNQTPLVLAFTMKNVEMIKALLYYYWEFSNARLTDVVVDLPNVPSKCEDVLLLKFALFNGCVEPFKLIWARLDHETLSKTRRRRGDTFLVEYFNKSAFPASDWLDCLYLILESPCLFHLLEQYNRLDGRHFLIDALDVLSEKNAKHEDRIALIYMCLSVGMRVRFCDIERMYNTAGFGEELEALIYAGNYEWSDPPLSNYLLLDLILSFREDCDIQKIFSYYCKQALFTKDRNCLIPWLKFFSLTPRLKSGLNAEDQTSAQFCLAPEFPSLLELSRNQVQKCIRGTHKITKPYEFHDAVKGLRLPKMLKDVVLFKKPIYK